MSLLFFPVKAANIWYMYCCNESENKLPKIRSFKLLTLRSHSFSGCGSEHVAVVFPSKGCQYLWNGCLQPIGTWITQDAKLIIVDAALTLILRMWHGACRCSLSQWRLTISAKWISTTNWKINYPRCEAKTHWRSVDAHSQDAAGSMSLSHLPIKAPNISVMHHSNQTVVQLPYLQNHKSLTLRWRSF